MGLVFAVESDNHIPGQVATVTARQLAAFRAVASAHEARFNVVIIAPGAEVGAAFSLEAHVCSMALAVIVKAFDLDQTMIALVDEAQFRGRSVRFERSAQDDEIRATIC